MKQYYWLFGIGRCRYAVSYHDGVSTHKDGSPFFGIALFRNKKKMQKFINGLEQDGYTEKNGI